MPILYQKLIKREDLKRNSSVLYLFGDNDARSGFGGQAAEMRGEPNAVGVRTKRVPGKEPDAYWNDKTLEQNCAKIENDLERAKGHLRRGGILVIPTDGVGTGYAEMQKRCPRTFQVLQQTLASLENVPSTIG